MDKILKIANRTAIGFTVFILVISIGGYLLVDDVAIHDGISSMFTTSQSIRYSTVFQGVVACFSISAFNVLFEDSKVLHKMLFLWKFVLQIIISILIITIFIILFDWFPIANLHAWIGFIIGFTSSTGLAILVMVYKTKKEDEVYQNLFTEYKKHHKGE